MTVSAARCGADGRGDEGKGRGDQEQVKLLAVVFVVAHRAQRSSCLSEKSYTAFGRGLAPMTPERRAVTLPLNCGSGQKEGRKMECEGQKQESALKLAVAGHSIILVRYRQ